MPNSMVTWNAIQEIIVKFTHNQYEVCIDVYAMVLKNKRNDKMNETFKIRIKKTM